MLNARNMLRMLKEREHAFVLLVRAVLSTSIVEGRIE